MFPPLGFELNNILPLGLHLSATSLYSTYSNTWNKLVKFKQYIWLTTILLRLD